MPSKRNPRPAAPKRRPHNKAPGATAPTKQEQLIRLLQRPSGATMAALIELTEWQPHTIRACISTVLRKRRGLTVMSLQNKQGQRIYRIAR